MTSIEWLISKLGISEITHKKLFDQAKEKYEEEMVGMYVEGGFAQMRFLSGSPYIDARQYYQETFISKGSDAKSDFEKPFMDFAKQYVEQLKTKK